LRGLAAFVMRGRFQALLVAVVGAGSLMFCWVSAAAVALVTLRKGAGQGAWLLAWALLPAGTLVYAYGDSGPLTLLLGSAVLAVVLRLTVNLPLALLTSVPVGGLTGLALVAFGGEQLAQIVTYFGEFLATLEQQLSQGGEAVVLARPDATQIAGILGAGTALGSVLSLLLARYWQAALYNPGGFGEEFRALYYPPAMTLAMAFGAIALAGMGVQYRSWAMICLLPLTFAGLALVHARAVSRGQGRGWLTGFYVAWLLFDPVKLVVVFAAIADSWFNFRQRWVTKSGSDSSERNDKEKDD
jgi:hypothetical protein